MPTGSQPVVLLLHHDHRRNEKWSCAPVSRRATTVLQTVAFPCSLAQPQREGKCSRRESHPHFSLRKAASYLLDDANVSKVVSPARLSLATLPFEAGRSGN